jgi:hypothetical protein
MNVACGRDSNARELRGSHLERYPERKTRYGGIETHSLSSEGSNKGRERLAGKIKFPNSQRWVLYLLLKRIYEPRRKHIPQVGSPNDDRASAHVG